MTTSHLIEILNASLATHGDMEVKIESSWGEYGPSEIRLAKPCRDYDGVVMLLASDDEDEGLRVYAAP